VTPFPPPDRPDLLDTLVELVFGDYTTMGFKLYLRYKITTETLVPIFCVPLKMFVCVTVLCEESMLHQLSFSSLLVFYNTNPRHTQANNFAHKSGKPVQ
jgi:hypothetical protein